MAWLEGLMGITTARAKTEDRASGLLSNVGNGKKVALGPCLRQEVLGQDVHALAPCVAIHERQCLYYFVSPLIKKELIEVSCAFADIQ